MKEYFLGIFVATLFYGTSLHSFGESPNKQKIEKRREVLKRLFENFQCSNASLSNKKCSENPLENEDFRKFVFEKGETPSWEVLFRKIFFENHENFIISPGINSFKSYQDFSDFLEIPGKIKHLCNEQENLLYLCCNRFNFRFESNCGVFNYSPESECEVTEIKDFLKVIFYKIYNEVLEKKEVGV